MKRIGRLIRSIRVPALIQGELTALDFPPLGGRWSALCFPSTFGLVESVFLDRQTGVFEREDAALFDVVPSEGTIRESWCRQFGTLRIPLLADPLRRLRKAFGLEAPDSSTRCQSLLLDPTGVYRFHLTHDLNGRGMSALLEIVRASRHQAARPAPASSTT